MEYGVSHLNEALRRQNDELDGSIRQRLRGRTYPIFSNKDWKYEEAFRNKLKESICQQGCQESCERGKRAHATGRHLYRPKRRAGLAWAVASSHLRPHFLVHSAPAHIDLYSHYSSLYTRFTHFCDVCTLILTMTSLHSIVRCILSHSTFLSRHSFFFDISVPNRLVNHHLLYVMCLILMHVTLTTTDLNRENCKSSLLRSTRAPRLTSSPNETLLI